MTTLSAASASIDVPELADLTHEKTLTSARFMKSVRARSSHGFVFVKAVMKPYPSFQVHQYVKQITRERNVLAQIPNTLGYQRIVEVGSGGFLVRQYVFSSVYDRLSTRPFLEDIEKKWLVYQLLCAVRDCHAQEIYHGDIKSENVLVTSWNWLYLTDFSSSFKPTTLPEDNPADFSFYFDTSGRRTCYLAPERFQKRNEPDDTLELTWATDMFSAGCVIAEMFLEGPIFSLSQVFKYRSGEYSPEHTHLNRIDDADVRSMILNMIELDPQKRYSAEQHLSFYKGKIFPDYFESFLHQYMFDLTEPASSQRQLGLDAENLLESDQKIERVYYDFDKISFFLGYSANAASSRKETRSSPTKRPRSTTLLPSKSDNNLYDGALLFLSLICSSLRNSTKAASRLKALDLLVAFAARLPDEAKLDRIVPYLVSLLSDTSDVVQASAVRALTSVLETVEVVSPINAFVMPEYVFPRLRSLVDRDSPGQTALVRATYASCLASLALSSTRLLDMVQAIRADGRLPSLGETEWTPATSYHALYDPSKEELVNHFEEATIALITDPELSVKRALLGSISQLCVFFGSARAGDVILTHLNTYLNERDWILKCSFFDALVGIASYIGTSSLEKFILPIMAGSMVDSEGFVVEKVFRSLSRMADLGLLRRSTTWELVAIAARFTVHPNLWIREAAVQFAVASGKYASKADVYCILLPMLQPYLKAPVLELSEQQVLDHLKKPLLKAVFNAAASWAVQRPKSLFWTAAIRDNAFILSDAEAGQASNTFTKRPLVRIAPSQRDKDDQTSLEILRNLGMSTDDESKLLALREHIARVAQDKQTEDDEASQQMMNDMISLHQIDVTPQNVLFDPQQPIREIRSRPAQKRTQSAKDEQHTLADALLDASTTMHGPPPRQTTPSREEGNSIPIDVRGRIDRQSSDMTSPTLRGDSGSPTPHLSSMNQQPSSSSLDKFSLRRGALELRHRNSAMNLIRRSDTGKADAETSTSAELAFGKVDRAVQRKSTAGPSALSITADVAARSRSKSPMSLSSRTPTYGAKHDYAGSDSNVLRLLDQHFVENFPIDQFDFGESRPPVSTSNPIKKATDVITYTNTQSAQDRSKATRAAWRPSGQLLTQFSEHTAAINQICAAPDHAFFITGSDDGTVKIWDTMRLEKNVTPRSRHTYRHAPGSKVKALCFVENSHTFISAADDGSVHAVRIDFRSLEGGEATKYGRPNLVRDWSIPQSSSSTSSSPERATHLYHYRTATSQSILIVATTLSRILLVDLKNMSVLHTMQNSLHHGAVVTFCVDKSRQWLLLGTAYGILSMWDLRYRVYMRSFGVPSHARIDEVMIHPFKGKGRWILVSSAGEITTWDIEKLLCREVYQPSSYQSSLPEKQCEAWYPDDTAPEQLISRFAQDHKDELSQSQASLVTPAMCTVVDQPSSSDSTRHPILFTGSSDRGLRYYYLPRPENSCIISGPQILSEDGVTHNKVQYEVSHPLWLSSGAQIALTSETIIDPYHSGSGSTKDGQRKGTPKKRPAPASRTSTTASTPTRRGQGSSEAPGTPSSMGSTADGATEENRKSKPPRNTVISAAAANLLKVHMDTITGVIVLRKPYGIVVSVDKGGSIYVLH